MDIERKRDGSPSEVRPRLTPPPAERQSPASLPNFKNVFKTGLTLKGWLIWGAVLAVFCLTMWQISKASSRCSEKGGELVVDYYGSYRCVMTLR